MRYGQFWNRALHCFILGAAYLCRPSGIRIFLQGLVGRIRPYLVRTFAIFNGLFLFLTVALTRGRYQCGIYDLPTHGKIAGRSGLTIKLFKQNPNGPGLGQALSETSDGILVWGALAQLDTRIDPTV